MSAADTATAGGVDTSPPPVAAPAESVGASAGDDTLHERVEAARRGARGARFRRRRGSFGLRRRILLVFTLGSLGLSAFLAFTSYGLVRSNLIEQRESASRELAYTHAQIVQSELSSSPASAEPAKDRLVNIGVRAPLIRYNDEWSSGVAQYGPERLPPRCATPSSTTENRPG